MKLEQTLMFCVGATKAGTSWLYQYLHGHDECALGAVKELHYFDSLDLDNAGFALKALEKQAAKWRAVAAAANGGERDAALDRVCDAELLGELIAQGEENTDGYVAYLTRHADGKKLVADLTPAYALLSEERLAQMADLAPDVRVVFIMRDPLDRLWSHVRMNAKRRLKPGQDIAQKSRNILNRAVRKNMEEGIVARGDYPVIVEKLKRAVPADRLHITFFEEMITPQGVQNLCDFLGLTYQPAQTEKRVHEGIAVKMNDGQKRAAQDYLAPHYAYVEKTFGPLPERWQANWRKV
ncbi:sulfotransferase [Celeribacter sp.]|uniref:sulfotransferase n=1 Tax=Celeribacter sp. TaxID=1890673 RepID=UPI003A8F6D0C